MTRGRGDAGHTDHVKDLCRASPHPKPRSLSGRGAPERIRTRNLRLLPLLHADGAGGWGDAAFRALGRDPRMFGQKRYRFT